MDKEIAPCEIEGFRGRVATDGRRLRRLTTSLWWCISRLQVMYMPLKRKQIYLDTESERRIRRLARATQLSEAEHIRRAVASYVADLPDATSARHPLVQMIGICEDMRGPTDAAVHHDRYLYGKKP
jgi:hypothetical protein